MKSTKQIVVLGLVVFLTGCASVFTPFKETAVDTLYIKKQCPTFSHQFEIPGKKYNPSTSELGNIIIALESMTVSLESNKKAREMFNGSIIEMNKDVLVKSESDSDHRVVKKVYVNQICPKYTYTPEFTARKLTESFNPENNKTYVVIPLDSMVFQIEKHKKTKETYNEGVDALNSKPFPLNILPDVVTDLLPK